MATYGIGAAIAKNAGRGLGPSLVEQGVSQKKEAIGALTTAAGEETRRNAQNTMLEAEAKQGNQMLGSAIGSLAGSAFGPVGSVIGGALGALGGSLFG